MSDATAATQADLASVRTLRQAIVGVLVGKPVDEACMACVDAATVVLMNSCGMTSVQALDALQRVLTKVRTEEARLRG